MCNLGKEISYIESKLMEGLKRIPSLSKTSTEEEIYFQITINIEMKLQIIYIAEVQLLVKKV